MGEPCVFYRQEDLQQYYQSIAVRISVRLRALQPRRDPYWQRLAAGAYLGFRRGPDTWHARFRGRDKRQQYQPLGEALEYDEAKRRAEEWLAQFTGSPVRAIKRGTVLAALDSYLNDLRPQDRADAATKAEGQFKTALRFDPDSEQYTDQLAALQLENATNDDFLDWRDRLRPGRLPRTVRQLDAAIAKREACRIYVPDLCEAAGFSDRAAFERHRFEMIRRG